MKRYIFVFFIIVAILIVGLSSEVFARRSSSVSSDGFSSSRRSVRTYYKKGQKALIKNDFELAIEYFYRAYLKEKSNPDILYMLGYSHQKLGSLAEALEYYLEVLELRPEFHAARKNLIELFVQAALEQIEILKGYGAETKKEMIEIKDIFDKAKKRI